MADEVKATSGSYLYRYSTYFCPFQPYDGNLLHPDECGVCRLKDDKWENSHFNVKTGRKEQFETESEEMRTIDGKDVDTLSLRTGSQLAA